jgi:hypothetical protein
MVVRWNLIKNKTHSPTVCISKVNTKADVKSIKFVLNMDDLGNKQYLKRHVALRKINGV